MQMLPLPSWTQLNGAGTLQGLRLPSEGVVAQAWPKDITAIEKGHAGLDEEMCRLQRKEIPASRGYESGSPIYLPFCLCQESSSLFLLLRLILSLHLTTQTSVCLLDWFRISGGHTPDQSLHPVGGWCDACGHITSLVTFPLLSKSYSVNVHSWRLSSSTETSHWRACRWCAATGDKEVSCGSS